MGLIIIEYGIYPFIIKIMNQTKMKNLNFLKKELKILKTLIYKVNLFSYQTSTGILKLWDWWNNSKNRLLFS